MKTSKPFTTGGGRIETNEITQELQRLSGGAGSLCLLALFACSTNETKYDYSNRLPYSAQPDQLCRIPKIKLKNNGDLVLALDKTLNALEQCRLKEQALTQCIENYNRTLQEKKHD